MNLNLKITGFEETIYSLESVQLDMLQQVKDIELQNQFLEDKIKQLIQDNEDLRNGKRLYDEVFIGHKNDRID